MTGSGGRIEVVYVGPAADETADRLEATSETLTVTPVETPEGALERLDEGADCLVTTHEPEGLDGLSLVERVTAVVPAIPTLVFAEPAEGLLDRALDAGATEYVPAAGPERYDLLAHRVESTVDHTRTLEDLERTEARFEALTENTNFAIVTIDADSTVQYASPAVEDLFGYEPAELIGEPLTGVMPERFQNAHHAAIDRYLDTDERNLDWGWIELPGLHRNGEEVPLGISFGEREGADGRLFTAVMRDISDRAEREKRLDRMAAAIEGSIDGVAILGDDGCYEYVNEAHAAVYGYDDPEEMVGTDWQTCYYDSEVQRFEREIMPTVAETGQWRGEATGRRRDGSTFPQEVSLTELDDGGLVCIVRDITERTDRRKQLREEKEFTETILDTLSDVFYVLDEEGQFRRWNDRFAEVTGYTDDELDGMSALEVVPDEDAESIAEAMMEIYQNGTTETRRSALVTKQGEQIPYELNGSQLTDSSGRVIGLTGIGRDITTEQLREQRLGVLSRVLRHNVRNRMTVIRGNTEYVAAHLDDETLGERLERIDEAATNLVEMSDHARNAESLLREEQATRASVDLVTAVEDGLADADTGRATVRTDLPDSARAIATESIHVAIAELVTNAVQHTDEATVEVTVEQTDDEVRVHVADDGPGIPDHEKRVLTAGRETPLEHSTGIGLWLVNWLLTVAGGDAQFRDSDLGGSEVVLAFAPA